MSGPGDVLVGIDLGGTYVRAGVLDFSGEVIVSQETPIEAARGPAVGVQRIQELIERILGEAGGRLRGIGIGSTGPVDPARGAIQNPYTLPTWEDVDILTPLRERWQVPAVLENDADAAALGEYWRGAGRSVERLAVVTVGTGIGTAFVYRGELYRGMNGVHPESGHQVLDPNGPPCYCGARGCWESLASGTALGQQGRLAAAQAIADGEAEKAARLLRLAQGDLESLTGALVAQAARENDGLAKQVIERAAFNLALGLVNVIIFFVPEVILLGGGVMHSYPLYEPTVQDVISRHSLMVPAHAVEIRPVALGRQAGVIGAGYAALQLLESQQ